MKRIGVTALMFAFVMLGAHCPGWSATPKDLDESFFGVEEVTPEIMPEDFLGVWEGNYQPMDLGYVKNTPAVLTLEDYTAENRVRVSFRWATGVSEAPFPEFYGWAQFAAKRELVIPVHPTLTVRFFFRDLYNSAPVFLGKFESQGETLGHFYPRSVRGR